jgi:hypothetical protein
MFTRRFRKEIRIGISFGKKTEIRKSRTRMTIQTITVGQGLIILSKNEISFGLKI